MQVIREGSQPSGLSLLSMWIFFAEKVVHWGIPSPGRSMGLSKREVSEWAVAGGRGAPSEADHPCPAANYPGKVIGPAVTSVAATRPTRVLRTGS
jgi:hypothetical protein